MEGLALAPTAVDRGTGLLTFVVHERGGSSRLAAYLPTAVGIGARGEIDLFGEWVGFENYVELLTSPDFRRVLWNTVVWLTLVGVGVRILLGLALAFLLNSATLKRWRLATLSRILLIG